MERLLTLGGAFGLSLIVALVAAWRLVEHFWYGEDLDLFVPPLAGFVLVATLIFGLAYARARSSRAFGMVAIALVAAALVIVATPFLAEYVAAQSKNPEVVLRPRSGKIKTVLLIPMLLAVATQWWFVRRRWLQARDLDHRTVWPWITTIAACVVMLSPIGLEILSAALAQSVDRLVSRPLAHRRAHLRRHRAAGRAHRMGHPGAEATKAPSRLKAHEAARSALRKSASRLAAVDLAIQSADD